MPKTARVSKNNHSDPFLDFWTFQMTKGVENLGHYQTKSL